MATAVALSRTDQRETNYLALIRHTVLKQYWYSTIKAMAIRLTTEDETRHWNDHILANPDHGNVFQGYEFAQLKKRGGWRPRFIVAGNVSLTALEKTVPGLGKLWYIPKGPGITSVHQLDERLPDLKRFAKKHGVFAIKIEPELLKTKETVADFMKLGLVKVRPIQPNFSTVLVDISPPLETVLAQLNQKGRHAIKRAERDGVTVQAVAPTDENCEAMYKLLAGTANGLFTIRSYSYYKAFWQSYASRGVGQLFFAYVDNTIVAGAYALAFGTKGTYKDGASLRERSVYGASHLLQWRVIEWLKSKHITTYDLCGTPPSDMITNTTHPHYGLGRFKTSFNKEVTDYVGAYDIVIRPTAYTIWRHIGERAALSLYFRLYAESYY